MCPQKLSPRVFNSSSEDDTKKIAADLAVELFARQPVFVQLKGPLGAGKTAFARGFLRKWSELAQDPLPQTITSPTYNLVKIYGKNVPVAHLDLYRIKSVEELEQIGFEQYFYEMPCCLVEWLDLIPETLQLRPKKSICVEISFESSEQSSDKTEQKHLNRTLEIQDL